MHSSFTNHGFINNFDFAIQIAKYIKGTSCIRLNVMISLNNNGGLAIRQSAEFYKEANYLAIYPSRRYTGMKTIPAIQINKLIPFLHQPFKNPIIKGNSSLEKWLFMLYMMVTCHKYFH
ncbi:hypothetical protein FACS1894200_10850 [Spirochaetia bacterium]|nr:hypothetical protein FACS1894200_10850 [Spirochaetia bacterium]